MEMHLYNIFIETFYIEHIGTRRGFLVHNTYLIVILSAGQQIVVVKSAIDTHVLFGCLFKASFLEFDICKNQLNNLEQFFHNQQKCKMQLISSSTAIFSDERILCATLRNQLPCNFGSIIQKMNIEFADLLETCIVTNTAKCDFFSDAHNIQDLRRKNYIKTKYLKKIC